MDSSSILLLEGSKLTLIACVFLVGFFRWTPAQFASTRNGNVQDAIIAQYARDVLNSRNLYYRG
eukprot:scaffold12474_cov78-Skeletonema_dohrnii-CCMP3373.AAC.2